MNNLQKTLVGTVLCSGTLVAVASIVQDALPTTTFNTRIIDGRAYVAVRDLQSIVNARFDPRTKTVLVRQGTPFLPGSSEAPFGAGTPFDYTSLGGVLAVRKHLDELQQQSAAQGSQRLLLRYEIVRSGYADTPGAVVNGIPSGYRPRFNVAALLYWATSNNFNTSLSSTQGDSGRTVTFKGPKPGDAQVEVRRYITAPRAFQSSTQNNLTFGPADWEILEESEQNATAPLKSRLPAPLYDMSAQQLNVSQIRKGVAYPGLDPTTP